ncbi:arylsulfatase [Bacteroidota bacterium]
MKNINSNLKNKPLSKKYFYKLASLIFLMLFFSGIIFGQTKPNIVIILADDLGYGCTGPYGAPTSVLQTPAINSLAEAGMKFTNAYTPSSLCSPTRYTLLTGRYYWRENRHWGIVTGQDTLTIPLNKPNIASRLKSEGYSTACIGKWHLGYTKYYPCTDCPKITRGALDIGFDYHHDYRWNINRTNKTRTAEFLDDKTNEWIDAQSSDTPFFLYFAPIAIHTPIIPGSAYQGKSNGGAYGDYIMELDGSVGNIIEALDRNGFTENTIVIFTSDNGATPGAAKEAIQNGLKINGDYRGTKLSIFEGGFRVPLIIKWLNNIAPGTTSSEKVNLIDIYASIMEMLNLEMQSQTVEADDSYSFYPAWFDDLSNPVRDNMILTNYEGITAIHSGGWKYIDGIAQEPAPYKFMNEERQAQEAHEQLYNIENDPYETHDLVTDNADKVIELSNLLQHFRNLGYSRTFDGVDSIQNRNRIVGSGKSTY